MTTVTTADCTLELEGKTLLPMTPHDMVYMGNQAWTEVTGFHALKAWHSLLSIITSDSPAWYGTLHSAHINKPGKMYPSV